MNIVKNSSVIVFLSCFANTVFADGMCDKNVTIFSCYTKNNKVLKVCHSKGKIKYSFGKRWKKPELTLTRARHLVKTTPWHRASLAKENFIEFPHFNTPYQVYSSNKNSVNVNKFAGVRVLIGNKNIGISCKKDSIVNRIPAFIEKNVNVYETARYTAFKSTLGYTDAKISKQQLTFHDLNNDGLEEAIIYYSEPSHCGSGGCSMEIYQQQHKHGRITFKRVAQTSVTRTPIYALHTKTHGWQNLSVGIGGGGIKSTQVKLKFNGKRYPSNPTISSSYIKEISNRDEGVKLLD